MRWRNRAGTRRLDEALLPERPAVVEQRTHYTRQHQCWLVLERDREPYGCFQDPLLDETRCVYVTAAIPVLLALTHGTRTWSDALTDDSITTAGDPRIVRQLPDWFR